MLNNNNFFLVVDHSGHILKTRSAREFDIVSNWNVNNNIVFADQVKNSHFLFFMCGSNIHKKKIGLIHVARPQSEMMWFDVSNLDLHGGNRIKKAWVGQKGANYEIF